MSHPRHRAAPAALLLLAAACATPDPRGEPSGSPKEPLSPAPVAAPTTHLHRDSKAVLQALKEAYEAERWMEVLKLSLECTDSVQRDRWTLEIAPLSVHASYELGLWEECVSITRAACLVLVDLPESEKRRDGFEGMTIVEAMSLLALDRSAEAAATLDRGAGVVPGLERDSSWKGLRVASRVGNGVKFEPYRGTRFPPDQVETGQRRLLAAMPGALAILRRRLGRPDLAMPPIGLFLDEDENSDYLMYTQAVRRGSHWVGVVGIRGNVVVHSTGVDEVLLAHELTHVLHLLGTGGVESPGWLREGLAHWLEAEDETWFRERILDRAVQRLDSPQHRPAISTILKSAEALEAADEDSQRLCGAVILFQLERMLGTESVRRLARRLLEEPDHMQVLREETRLEFQPLLDRVRTGYLEWARATFPGTEELLAVSKLASEGRFQEAVAAVDQFLAKPCDGALRSVAELLRLNLLIHASDWPAAREALGPIRTLRRIRPLSVPVAEGVIRELTILEASEDWRSVVELASTALDSPWVESPENRAEVRRILAEAERRLAEAAPPK